VAAGLTLLPVGLLLLQPDFGSAAVLIALVGLLLFVAGMPLRSLFLLAFAAGAGAAGYIAMRPYALARLRGFLDPWATAGREGFQLVQSFVAFGRGGGLGVGIGDGRQKLFFLPEAHTDFVLSVVAEEFGLVGLLVVLGAFAALVVAGTRVAGRARDPFCRLVAFGMTAFIALPAAVNAAVVMGLLPTTGFTLPFISFGANSLIVCSIAVGVLLRIASHEVPPPRRRVASASPRGLLHT
jgi:cell division protein FtsW